jgi:GT2 family glycosyltransferase
LNCVSSRHWVKAHFYFHPNNKLNFNIFWITHFLITHICKFKKEKIACWLVWL